ncbi:hypothetical protein B0O99DRAFT_689686 [Bisporella sp. PMI_857]|nr:hypothetical protein B0O99DRAFT_689686 [Bisporella sp. PMI_857]
MGLFKHKDKTRPDLDPSPGPSKNLPANPNQKPQAGQNSFNDSGYSGSDVSNLDLQKAAKNQQQAQGKPPGTTVTTTTTTTTTTTVVTADGTTQTFQHPYDPSTDPPPQQSQTTYIDPNTTSQTIHRQAENRTPVPSQHQPIEATPAPTAPPPAQRPQFHRIQTPPRKPTPQDLATMGQHELPTPGPYSQGALQQEQSIPRANSTSGGRAIPPRSELRPTSTASPYPQPLNTNPHVQPLNTNQSPHSPHSGIDPAVAASPTSPIAPNGRSKTPNFSRPDAAHHASKRESVGNVVKGIHGAGEALRGTVNSTIARGMGDAAELERSRSVKEQGLNEFRGSGLREGFREKAEGRMKIRRRSGSANPGEGHGHVLDRVDEVR